MKSFFLQTFAIAGTLGAALPMEDAAPAVAPRQIVRRSGGIWATPHESYSSSVGVLGCKINVDRVAYWPGSIDCDNICVKVKHGGRSLHLLRIDTSEGAHDMSYDAWNYLVTGKSARDQPTTGGPVAMDYEEVDPDNCRDLITSKDKKLPLSAANSMNYLASCLGESGSWVAKNYRLYNVLDPICTLGYDEPCTLDWPTANQANCPNQLGVPQKLTDCPVYNVQYATGKDVLAGSNQVVDVDHTSDSPAPLSPSGKISFTYTKTTPAESPAPQEAQPQYPQQTAQGAVDTGVNGETYDANLESNPTVPGAVYYASPSSSPTGYDAPTSSQASNPEAGQQQPKKVEQAAAHTIVVPVSILVPILVSLLMG